MAHIEELMIESHYLAREKGFWEGRTEDSIPGMLALIHSEVSEALEEYRKWAIDVYRDEDTGKPEGFGVELADAVIRICDLACGFNIPLADLIREKLDYNKTRPHMHGGKRI